MSAPWLALSIYTEDMKKKKKKRVAGWKRLVVAAIAAGAIGGGALATGNLPYFKGEKVIEVVDGDTFIIESHQPVRLYGLDAPELENCMGQDAKQALSSLILNKRVQLREPVTDRGTRRVMTLVYSGGKLINEVMIRAGLAEYSGQGQSQKSRMKEANDYARTNHIGIFSPVCYQFEPPDPSCVIKGNYKTYQYKKLYATPGCRHYSQIIIMKHQGDAWFCTESEAKKAGFTKSEECK